MIYTKNRRSAEVLKSIPPPTANAKFVGLPHTAFLGAVLAEARKRNWQPHNLRVHLGRRRDTEALEMVASFDIKPDSAKPIEGWVYGIGLQNNNAGESRPKIYAGLVRVDDGPGVPFTEHRLASHRPGALTDLDVQVAEAFNSIDRDLRSFPRWVKALTKLTLDRDRALFLMAEVARRPYYRYPWSRIGRVDRGVGDRQTNGWEILTLFAAEAKLNAPLLQLRQVHALTKRLLQETRSGDVNP